MNLFNVFHGNPDSLKDSYIRHFVKCNHYKTFEEITSQLNFHPHTSRKKSKTCKLDTENLIKSLRNKNLEGYLYIKTTQIDGANYTFCKFTSPSLFMHMNNSTDINMINDYSNTFCLEIYNERKEIMVPFP
jgi:hypothetical protein